MLLRFQLSPAQPVKSLFVLRFAIGLGLWLVKGVNLKTSHSLETSRSSIMDFIIHVKCFQEN